MKPHTLFVILALYTLNGCVSIDSRTSKEPIDESATASISGKFSNHAKYISSGEFISEDNLASLLFLPYEKSQFVFVSFNEKDGLKLEFDGSDKAVIYKAEDGLLLRRDGTIQLPAIGGCGGGGGGVGCHRRTVIFFINNDGDLAAIRTGKSVGLVAVIPIGIYAKHLSIFPRVSK
jgi:hypothetical protein